MNKFTIITSSYNKEKYLREWMDSILIQKYRPLEVIFIDDCSTDNTYNFILDNINKFKDIDIDVIPFRNNERMHVGSSYFKAFKLASGFFVGVLDSDDMLVPQATTEIMRLYKKYENIGYIYSQFIQVWADNMSKTKGGNSSLPNNAANLLDAGKKGQHCYSHWRTFSRRVPDLDSIFGRGMICSEDKYMGYKLEERAFGGFYPVPLYVYRYNSNGSLVKSVDSKKYWKDVITICDRERSFHKISPKKIVEIA